jgi:hypothetical protein
MSINASFGKENGFEVDKPNKKDDIQESKNDDIFNAIPIEIANEENYSYEYYNYFYIKQKLSYSLNNIFNIIQKRINNQKNKFFFTLKQNSNIKYSKLINAELLYMLIETNSKIIEHIWHQKRIDILNDVFTRIKKYNVLNEYYKSYDSKKNIEINQKINEIEEKMKKIEKIYNEKLNDVDILKNKEENTKKENIEIKNRINNLEEKYNMLIDKNKELKEFISLSRQKSAKYNYEVDTNGDKRIIELQNKIKIKEKETEDQIKYCELFYQNMNDILSQYESKYDTIKSTINTTNQNI